VNALVAAAVLNATTKKIIAEYALKKTAPLGLNEERGNSMSQHSHPHEKGETKFKQSNPKDPKIIQIKCLLQPDGNCDFKLDYNNLNPEQLAKVVLFLTSKISEQAFQLLHPLVGGKAYMTQLPHTLKPGEKPPANDENQTP